MLSNISHDCNRLIASRLIIDFCLASEHDSPDSLNNSRRNNNVRNCVSVNGTSIVMQRCIRLPVRVVPWVPRCAVAVYHHACCPSDTSVLVLQNTYSSYLAYQSSCFQVLSRHHLQAIAVAILLKPYNAVIVPG